MPQYYIVPSKIVAETVKKEYEEWLKQPGAKGQPHKDNSVRNFILYNDEYKDNWNVLKQ